MGKIDIVTEWANTGEKIAPVSLKVADGWLPNEEPPCEWENYEQNKRDVKLNEIIRDGNLKRFEPANNTITDNVSGIPTGNEINHLYSPKNKYNLGVGAHCACVGYDYTLKVYGIYIAKESGSDYRTHIHFIYTDPITEDITKVSYPITLNDIVNEEIVCMTSDGIHLYLVTCTTTDTTVYCFETVIWDISGTPIWDTGISGKVLSHSVGGSQICVASSTKLAIIFDGELCSGSPIYILDKITGVVDHSGRGNAPNDSGYRVSYCLASDGTNIYFSIWEVAHTVKPKLCAAKITTAGIPTAPVNPIQITDDDFLNSDLCMGIVCEGNNVWWTQCINLGGSNMRVGLFVYNSINDASQVEPVKKWKYAYTVGGSTHGLTFDGLNIWGFFRYMLGADTYQGYLTPILAEYEENCVLYNDHYDDANGVDVIDPKKYFINNPLGESYDGVPSNVRLKGVFYSGDSIWVVLSETHYIRRLPLRNAGR